MSQQKRRYAKGVAKRAEILDTALVVIDENGYSGATVKELADAVDLTQNGLLYYFGSKDALFLEIMQRHDAQVERSVDPEHTDFSVDLGARILDSIMSNLDAPGISQLVLSQTLEAVAEGHLAHEYIQARYDTTREIAERALIELQRRGEFPGTADPAVTATLIVAGMEGLQLQWLHDRRLDVRACMAELLTSLGLPAPVAAVEG